MFLGLSDFTGANESEGKPVRSCNDPAPGSQGVRRNRLFTLAQQRHKRSVFWPPVTGSFLIPECQRPELCIFVVLCSDSFCLAGECSFPSPQGFRLKCQQNLDMVTWFMIFVLYNSLEGSPRFFLQVLTALRLFRRHLAVDPGTQPSDISIPQLCHSKSESWGDMSWNGLTSRFKFQGKGSKGKSHKSWPQADWSNMTLGGNRFHSPITAILDVYCQIHDTVASSCVSYQANTACPASIPTCRRLHTVPSLRQTRRPWPCLTKVPCAVELPLPCLKKGASTGKLQNALREINATWEWTGHDAESRSAAKAPSC